MAAAAGRMGRGLGFAREEGCRLDIGGGQGDVDARGPLLAVSHELREQGEDSPVSPREGDSEQGRKNLPSR